MSALQFYFYFANLRLKLWFRSLFPFPESPAEQKKVLRQASKFLVVRHPFDRIISAYTGKIANPMAKPRFYRQACF